MRVLALLLFVCSSLFAQSDRGTITGRVLDPTTSAIPRAGVSAANQATGVKYSATTNEAGNFSIQQVPVGRYDVSIEAPGFRWFVQKDIEMNVAQTITLNISLEVGQVEQAVEVSAAAPLVDSSTSDLGTVISSERIMDLPLSVSGNMRNPEAFIFLTPGVTGDTGNTQINGSQSRAKEVLLDGIGSTSPESGGLLFTYPSVEAIGEFKLVSGNFSAEFGRTGGGFEIFTTKSGGNQYHGSLFEYFRNNVFDARGFYSRITPVNRQNEYGGAFGGPIRKNKTFFHFVFSGFRYRAGSTNELLSIPTEDFRKGDFSRLVDTRGSQVRIFDPATTRLENGVYVRSQFPNNVIPQNRFSAVSKAILPLFPATTNSGILNNFLSIGAQRFDRDQFDVKIDHSFSDRSRVSVFTYIGTQKSVAPERIPNPLSNALDEDRRSRWVRLTHDFIFSPATLNHFTLGFTREGQFWRKLSADQDWPNKIGLKGVQTGEGNAFPRVEFTDGYYGIAPTESKSVGSQVNNAWQLNDTVSHIRGNHSLKFGLEARWQQTNGADFFGSQGQFNFSNLETALPGVSGTGNAFASFLLGTADRGQYNMLAVVPGNRYRYLAGFGQDDWKISRKLTLNLGLRYEIFFPRTEAHDNLSGFDPSLPNPKAGGKPGAIAFLGEGSGRIGRSSFADTYWRNFGPRIGFAYAANDKTVLRGGYGVYFAPGNATAGLRASQQFGFGFNASPTFSSTNAGVTPAFNWDDGFPQNFTRPPIIDPSVSNGFDVNYMGRTDGRPPYFQNWLFGIQRELPMRTAIELSYVGNKGTRLGTGLINLNELDPRYLSLGSTLLARPVTSAEAQAANIPIPYAGFTGSVAQALRPYPQYTAINNRANPNGNSTYNALQAKIEKRFSRGFTALAAYTFAKSISDANVQAGGGPGGQTYYNRKLEKAIYTDDVPHVFALSYVYELPFGPGRKWLAQGPAAKVFGGWSITGIHQYQAGKPIVLTANNSLPLFNSVLRPDVIAGVPKTLDFVEPATDRYINPAAFAVPAPLRFGTAARSYTDLRTFNFLNESFGALKRTRLTERFTLTFRAEFFNAFNRVVFSAPAANVSASNFGRVSGQANSPRQGQLALRLDF